MKAIRDALSRRLEYKTLALILVVLIISFAGIYFMVSSRERVRLLDDQRAKAKLMADTIHETLDRSMMAFQADVVRFLVTDFEKLEGIKRIQIVRGDAAYVGEGRGREKAFMDFKTLDDVKQRIPTLYRPGWEINHPRQEVNVAGGIENPEFKNFFEKTLRTLKEKKLASTEEKVRDEKAMKQGMSDGSYVEEIEGVPVMTYLRPLPDFPKCALCHGTGHSLRGILMISTSMEELNIALKQSERYLLTASVTAVLVLLILMRLMMKRVVLNPVGNVMARVRDIAEGEGDLTARITVKYEDEIGQVAQWFNLFIEKLHRTISQVSQTSRQVTLASGGILMETKQIMEGADVQIGAMNTTSAATEAMTASTGEMAQNAESLNAMAEESSAAILQMSSSIDEIVQSTAALSASVEDSMASILEMSASIKRVNESVEGLNAAAETTQSSMNEMDAAIGQIRSNVQGTVQLSRGATEEAERGRRATEMTIEGMGKIKDYSQQVNAVIHDLNARTENIGQVLNVIDEVAEQTNLLALNAAIIAAQSGEYGKSFAVVALEMKELADRTANSTSEIHAIVQALKDESKKAVMAIGRTTESVEEGIHLSEEAGVTLNKILEGSRQSTERIQEIARATDEQTQNTKHVAEAMREVTTAVQGITRATHEQSKGSEFIVGSIEKMKEVAATVKRSTREQSLGNKQITQIVENVGLRVKEIAQATGKQAEQSAHIMKAVSQIKLVIEQNVDAIGKVGLAVEEMMKQATQLTNEMDKFKL